MPRRSLPIRRLPSGRWQSRPTGVDPATFDDYDSAEAWTLDQLTARGRGTAPPRGTSRVTFREYAEEWAAAQPWAPRTRDRFKSSLTNQLYPRIGQIPIVRLRRTQMQGLITSLSDDLAPGTVALVHQHLCQVLSGAVADGIRPDNPAARLRLPRPDGGPLVIPNTAQVHRLAEVIRPSSRALVAVGAGLGLRQAEAFALTRGSVDFLRRVVHVTAQLRKTNQGKIVLESTTKTGLARDVPLPDVVAAELASHLEHYDKNHPDGLIFTSPQGMKLRFDGWNESIWKPATRQAGFDAGYHSLRHFCATSLLRKGVSVAAVAKTLGNTPATLVRYYAHWIADDTDLVRNTLDQILATPGNAPEQPGTSEA